MKISVLAAVLLAGAAPAPAAERRYTVTDFDRIKVEGPFQVTLSTGGPSGAVATGSARALDGVSVDVNSRVLRIGRNPNAWGGYPGEAAGPVKIEVSTRTLREAAVEGAGIISIDKAAGLRFQASVMGSGQIGIGSLQADVLSVGLIGSGKLKLTGKAKELKATVSGSGDLDAANLTVEDADIKADTAGLIGVNVKRAAKVFATGSGNVTISGPASCTVEDRGGGNVSCGRN
jgi:hypothetical protein